MLKKLGRLGCISEGFVPGSHQPKVLIHQTFQQLTAAFISGNVMVITTDEGSSELLKRLVYQNLWLVTSRNKTLRHTYACCTCLVYCTGLEMQTQVQPITTTSCRIPYVCCWITRISAYLASFVKGTCSNLVPKRVIEGYGIHHIAMPLQGQQLFTRCCVPHLARPVVTSSNEA